ncbi:MAG: F0F1 ATP synthase subunit A [Planctomycetota bacterium]|jgi:F-type H+-transporting ATPase subunit a
MSNLLLHIKDAYYFEVPKFLWQSQRKSASEFPDWIVRNDPGFQHREATSVAKALEGLGSGISADALTNQWSEWQSRPGNFGRPMDVYLDMGADAVVKRATRWSKKNAPTSREPLSAYLASSDAEEPLGWFARLRSDPKFRKKWEAIKDEHNSNEFVGNYLAGEGSEWSASKIEEYNHALSGKILIPQIFGGKLRNAYEPESGFCLSKFMIIELVVALLLVGIFAWLGRRIQGGAVPKGRAWNLLEGLMEYVRKQVFEPAMGPEDSRRFMPLLATLFVFIFGLNLAGMIPFLGAPTASLACTAALALVVFAVGLVWGVRAMGPVGYLKNLCPEMGLPPALAIIIVPMLWSIEFISLFMKHGILALRLLANMVAGHAVLLGLMGLAVGSAALYTGASFGLWTPLGLAIGLGMVGMSLLELFIAFLQAAMFTFLAGLFISSSIHHH